LGVHPESLNTFGAADDYVASEADAGVGVGALKRWGASAAVNAADACGAVDVDSHNQTMTQDWPDGTVTVAPALMVIGPALKAFLLVVNV
jgi:hypothetical protein